VDNTEYILNQYNKVDQLHKNMPRSTRKDYKVTCYCCGSNVKPSVKTMIKLIIDTISIPLGGFSEELTPFCGNQHNPEWRWNKKELESLSLKKLINFYDKHRSK
jgi:hypothetical protein